MNDKTNSTDTAPPTLSPPGTSRADDDDDAADTRVRPGRRTVEERQRAVLDLFAGKATIDQIARRLGVHADTVEGWRQDALGGVAEALRRGSGKTPAELELERKNQELEQVVTKLSIQKCLLENALETERAKRPTVPARSKRRPTRGVYDEAREDEGEDGGSDDGDVAADGSSRPVSHWSCVPQG